MRTLLCALVLTAALTGIAVAEATAQNVRGAADVRIEAFREPQPVIERGGNGATSSPDEGSSWPTIQVEPTREMPGDLIIPSVGDGDPVAGAIGDWRVGGEPSALEVRDASPGEVAHTRDLLTQRREKDLLPVTPQPWTATEFKTDPRLSAWIRKREDESGFKWDGVTIPASLISPFQVLPGEEIDDAAIQAAPCTGAFCGTPSHPNLDEKITYAKGAHDEVALLSYQAPDMVTPQNHCSGFAVSRRQGLSALHCFGLSSDALKRFFTFSESGVEGWTTGLPTGQMAFHLVFRGDPASRRITRIAIPYALPDPPRYVARAAPRIDLALFEFEQPLAKRPTISRLGAPALLKGEAITFSGHGLTTESFVEGWRRYAAFNVVADLTTDALSDYLLWRSGEQEWSGGPCSGDSGGPVYQGFQRGFADDPNTIIAVVSRFEGGGDVVTAYSCLERPGLAIRLDRHVNAICALARSEPEFCVRG